MPVYSNQIAPHCPISRDQMPADMRPPTIRTTIPPARDLLGAIAAINIARSIVIQMTQNYVRNNFYSAPPVFAGGFKDLRRSSRWVEQPEKRVKRKYKYYFKEKDGTDNKDIWVETERIERMVWYDTAWKSYLVWNYGDKGEGVPVNASGGDE